ncbi:MAG: LPS-assembly protein LptD [Halanaerobiales bacterium]|nr:LPS-assembly protein LptD [Halanaerobiales bacterium]
MDIKFLKKLIFLLILIILLIVMVTPAFASETVKGMGDYVKYSVVDDSMIFIGNAQIITEEATIKADQIIASLNDGEVIEIKATGHVEMKKDNDTFTGTELTYQIKSKTGILLEVRGNTEIKDSEEKAHIYGKEAHYKEDFIEILGGHITTCDLDEPHYHFKAKKIIVYPGDKIKAYHLTFWEFNGKIPLLYWPYYTMSLKEKDQKFTPKIGYNSTKGWYIKTTYNYFWDNGQYGELYGDYFQKAGPAGGFKHYYVDEEKNTGSVYLYLQKQDEQETYPYLIFQHSQKYTWENLYFDTNSAVNRYGYRDTLSSVNNIRYTKGRDYLKLSSNYYSAYNNIREFGTNTLKNSLKLRWNLAGVTLQGELSDNRYFHQTTNDLWKGYIKANKNKPFFSWSWLIKKKGSSNPDYEIYTLSELEAKMNFSRLKTDLKPYISPFKYTTTMGRFIENRTEVDAYRWQNKLDFRKEFRLLNPFKLVLSNSGSIRLYSTYDWICEYNPTVELKTSRVYGIAASVKYSYKDGEGDSPFYFDRYSNRTTQKVTGNISYSKNGLNITTRTGYNLETDKFDSLSNSLNYRWGKNNKFSLSVPFDLNYKKFTNITGSATINEDDLTLKMAVKVNPTNWDFSKIESKLNWQINDDWKLNLATSFDPDKLFTDSKSSGKIELIRDLHCREISLSYDVVKKEAWFNYHIKAFPKEKIKFGTSADDPFLFDTDLGGGIFDVQ